MGQRAETHDEIRKELVTKIHGQPMDHDITTLVKEHVVIAASIPSRLGGGNHGHAGIIVETTKYLNMAGVPFIDPIHPGIYPTGLATTAAAGTRAKAEAEHKESLAEYEIFKGVEQALKDIILEAVEHDYLLEIKDNTLGFLNQMPKQIIDHLKIRGGVLDFADTKTLIAERDMEWDVSENPQIYFNRVKKAVKALTRANINTDMNQLQDMALYHFKVSGEFDAAVREWENKASADKTWSNIKTFISAEYARKNKQNKLTARQFKANAMEEQAEATEDLIAALTENHTHQIKMLIKSTTDALKEMMQLVKNQTTMQSNPTNVLPFEEKKKKYNEKRKKFWDAPVCTHCGRRHPSKKEDECWELKKNKATRPANWKSSKST
jgi:hypothetical protein